jgi:hypothetical protein
MRRVFFSLLFLFFNSHLFAQDLLQLSCLFNWQNLAQPVNVVEVHPGIENTPTYSLKTPKEYNGNLPNSCSSALKSNKHKLRIIMDDRELLKMSFEFVNPKPILFSKFTQIEQLRIEKELKKNGIAFSNLDIKMEKVRPFEYSIQFFENEHIKERLIFTTEAMYQYE